jgi:hypothetical protein
MRNPVNIFAFIMKTVKAGLKGYIIDKQQTGSHSYDQTQYIDQRENFVSPQVPPCDDKVILKHDCLIRAANRQDKRDKKEYPGCINTSCLILYIVKILLQTTVSKLFAVKRRYFAVKRNYIFCP